MAGETMKAIKAADGSRLPNLDASSFVTTGEGASLWRKGACSMLISHREAATDGDAAMAAGEAALEALIGALADLDINEDDIRGKVTTDLSDGGSFAIVEASVILMDSDLRTNVAKKALSIGFRESRTGTRQEVTIEDANERACRQAIDDATANLLAASTRLQAAGLSVVLDEMALVEMRIETIAGRVPSEIRKRAVMTWRPFC